MHNVQKEIISLAKKHGLQLKEDTLRINESGLDFQVAFATDTQGGDWILRFPRRKDVFDRTQSEKTSLDFIGEHVAFEVPRWEIYTEELIAYKALTGTPAATIDEEKQAYV